MLAPEPRQPIPPHARELVMSQMQVPVAEQPPDCGRQWQIPRLVMLVIVRSEEKSSPINPSANHVGSSQTPKNTSSRPIHAKHPAATTGSTMARISRFRQAASRQSVRWRRCSSQWQSTWTEPAERGGFAPR